MKNKQKPDYQEKMAQQKAEYLEAKANPPLSKKRTISLGDRVDGYLWDKNGSLRNAGPKPLSRGKHKKLAAARRKRTV